MLFNLWSLLIQYANYYPTNRVNVTLILLYLKAKMLKHLLCHHDCRFAFHSLLLFLILIFVVVCYMCNCWVNSNSWFIFDTYVAKLKEKLYKFIKMYYVTIHRNKCIASVSLFKLSYFSILIVLISFLIIQEFLNSKISITIYLLKWSVCLLENMLGTYKATQNF